MASITLILAIDTEQLAPTKGLPRMHTHSKILSKAIPLILKYIL